MKEKVVDEFGLQKLLVNDELVKLPIDWVGNMVFSRRDFVLFYCLLVSRA